MHNSQNDQTVTSVEQEALMNDTCIGCHSTTLVNGNSGSGFIPVVFNSQNNPGYTTGVGTHNNLAGGNFYWVMFDDLKGHNVEGIASQSTRTPPGGSTSFTTLTCAGVNGCHGDGTGSEVQSIWGSHHETTNTIDGSSPANSYRMLNGVLGYEDPDWEHTLNTNDHNVYKGARRFADIGWSVAQISNFCARCHGNFHNDDNPGDTGTAGGTFSSPWIRHPMDIDIGAAYSANPNEFAYGGGGVAATYQVQTPLAFETIPSPPPPSTIDISSANGEGIITCLSCHRAHGSPYDYSLRWDYMNWPGTGYNGCGDCHTAKN